MAPKTQKSPAKRAEPPVETPKAESGTEKVTRFVKEYGVVGLLLHVALTLIFQGIVFAILKMGWIDITPLLRLLGQQDSSFWKNAGAYAIAVALSKILLPIRLVFTLAVLSFLAKKGLLKKKQE